MNMEGWILSGAQAMTTVPQVDVSDRVPGFRTLTITVAAGSVATLIPSPWAAEPPGGRRAASEAGCAFGMFVNTSQYGPVVATMKSPSGSLVASASHPGDGNWRFIGMASGFDPSNGPLPKFYFQNDQNSDPLVVHVTAPAFAFGRSAPSVGSAAGSNVGGYTSLVANGGITGRSSTVEQSQLSLPTGELTLQRDANLFIVGLTTNSNIRRLNQKAADRFLAGTVITLVFEQSGVHIRHGGYLSLHSETDWISTAGASMTMFAKPSGTWQEISSQT